METQFRSNDVSVIKTSQLDVRHKESDKDSANIGSHAIIPIVSLVNRRSGEDASLRLPQSVFKGPDEKSVKGGFCDAVVRYIKLMETSND